jgi:hypothetical protein
MPCTLTYWALLLQRVLVRGLLMCSVCCIMHTPYHLWLKLALHQTPFACRQELWGVWKALLKMNVRGQRSVRLVVNTRVDLGGGLAGADQIHLGPLPVADAEQLLRLHCGKGVQWEEGQAAELAENVCRCHPYALTIIGGFLAARRCTPQVRCCR